MRQTEWDVTRRRDISDRCLSCWGQLVVQRRRADDVAEQGAGLNSCTFLRSLAAGVAMCGCVWSSAQQPTNMVLLLLA